MKTNEKNKREKKSYYAIAFRWKLIQELAAELLTEQQACEKYGITIILIRKWRKQYYQRKIQPLQTTQPMERKQGPDRKDQGLGNQSSSKLRKPSRTRKLKAEPMRL